MFNKKIESFENLLKSRLAGVLPVVKKPRERDYKASEARRKDNPKRKAYNKKYYLEHAEELKEKRRKYNASSWGKKVNSEYSREYRLKKGEEEKARKRAWYHANKVLKGTPRGRKPKAKPAAENLEQINETLTKE